MVMSALALTVLMVHMARFGTARAEDEGATAHIWQLLVVGQVPIIAFFAFRWFRQNPLVVLEVPGLQLAAIALCCAPVFIFGL